MGTLFVETRQKISDAVWTMPVESFIVLHTIYCLNLEDYKIDLKIILVESTEESQEPYVPINVSLFIPQLTSVPILPPEAYVCKLPVFVAHKDGVTTITAGLSAVLRGVLRCCSQSHPLLGFRQTCLIACAEVSVWTRFCEVDVIASVKEQLQNKSSFSSVPVDVARLEEHLSHPPRLHNARKHRQNYARTICSTQREEQLPHCYAEGPYMTLADIMIFPSFYILLHRFSPAILQSTLPLVSAWFSKMLESQEILRGAAVRDGLKSVISNFYPEVEYDIPSVPKESLYRSDPSRYKPRSNKAFTHQEDVELSLSIVSDLNKHNIKQFLKPFGSNLSLEWNGLPLDVRPEGGHLPETRQLRKSEQLLNMARAIMELVQPGHTLVDFCSGSGHLGLLLAWLLPSCRVLLLENKHESLQRAAARVKSLSLKNVQLVQGNIDYFKGKFDVGFALHACGVATDLVLQLSETAGAAFVVCPCCYGSIQNGHTVTYPRSKIFRTSSLTNKDYLVLGHCADQTHGEEDEKTQQGHQCMAAIDTDRLLHSQEIGYSVHLSKMVPQTCSPKNNLLVGIPPGRVDILHFDSLSMKN